MNQEQPSIPIQTIVQMIIFIIIVPLLPLLISGRWDWWEAWIYAVINILGFIVSRLIASQRHPDLMQERAQSFQNEDAAAWDKVLSPLMALGGSLLPLTAGLDARLQWSGDFTPLLSLLGFAAILFGYILGSWALIVNRYFSGMVRIQHDRGHRVVQDGPYQYVRHPGYTGALLSFLGTPLLLNAAWAFIPAVMLLIVVIVRTYMEDRILAEQLDGYPAYVKEVSHRLIPGVW